MGNASHVASRKRNCLLENPDSAPLSKERAARATSAESLDSEAEHIGVGTAFKTTSYLILRKVPEVDAYFCLRVPLGVGVVLLKTLEKEETGTWGLVAEATASATCSEGLLGEHGSRQGWIHLLNLEGEVVAPLERARDLGWEVGRAYTGQAGTKLRRTAELSSDRIEKLSRPETVEVLELCLDEAADGTVRLRAKVLTWRGHVVGWVSPQHQNGRRLLVPLEVGKLDMEGRTTQLFHRSWGGA